MHEEGDHKDVIWRAEVSAVKSQRPPVTIRQKTAIQQPKTAIQSVGAEIRVKSGQWIPGTSGNPAGRPRGSRNASHNALLSILVAEGEQVIRRVISDALAGDQSAAKLVLDRILPRSVCEPRSSLPRFPIRSATDASAAMGLLVEMTLSGEMSPVDAEKLANVLEAYRRTLESAAIEERLHRLEQAMETHQ
jgi:hypothetical protein